MVISVNRVVSTLFRVIKCISNGYPSTATWSDELRYCRATQRGGAKMISELSLIDGML